ncbi:AER069Wp [Eremothecium gossypii ATCC 10895]|uniref:Endoplasmic reticulum transmembrane protein n=1 Tax=Eremothecium gossypii (strain ATCC 10895 / CBS 109.51 / FGSC 9923 / NRRL Y-1056) TaxID=284811 RepID=Q757E4_EREGS|nr:AER069Wp [Eremothecium gossypii ATCC 10895]AAS52753.1 AER069Wp [Eremothecium gossypii ATCC 10895]AEY97059.1 FAER069Wp [Eremothecium gossypii FDAG1]
MSLYYSLVFAMLVCESAVFALLAVPLPMAVRRPLTRALARPFESATVQMVLKVLLGFVLLLFVDTTNRLYVVNREYERARHVEFAHGRRELLSRKFLAQRNMYLTGITLFLTFMLGQTFNLVLELLALKGATERPGATTAAGLRAEIEECEKELARLKAQADALAEDM